MLKEYSEKKQEKERRFEGSPKQLGKLREATFVSHFGSAVVIEKMRLKLLLVHEIGKNTHVFIYTYRRREYSST